MKRPHLNRIKLSEAIPFRKGHVTVTMGIGQWDTLLLVSYESGFTLLELDEDEYPVAAYRNPHPIYGDDDEDEIWDPTRRLTRFMN